MLRPLLCPVPSLSAHSSLRANQYSPHLRPKWYPPPRAFASDATRVRHVNSRIIRNAIEGNLSVPAPSMPPCPFEQRSNNNMPPLISDSSSDSDTYYTPPLQTTITDASSSLLHPPPTPPTAPTLSSSRSLPHPLLWNLHPTPFAASHSTPPSSPLHPPHLCLATSDTAHLPPPRQHPPGLHITNCPSSPRSLRLASLPLGRNAKFASTHGIAPPVCLPLHHSEGRALSHHRSGRPPMPAVPTMARFPPHRPSLSMPAPDLPPALSHRDPLTTVRPHCPTPARQNAPLTTSSVHVVIDGPLPLLDLADTNHCIHRVSLDGSAPSHPRPRALVTARSIPPTHSCPRLGPTSRPLSCSRNGFYVGSCRDGDSDAPPSSHRRRPNLTTLPPHSLISNMLPTPCNSPFRTAPVPTLLLAPPPPSLSFTNRTPFCRLASAPLSTSAKYWRPVSLSSGIITHSRYRAHLPPIRRFTAPAHLSPVHPSPFPSPVDAIPPSSLLSLSTLSTTCPPEPYVQIGRAHV